MKKLRTILIGLGKQSLAEHLPALIASEYYSLDAVVDTEIEQLNFINNNKLSFEVGKYHDITTALNEKEFDVAVIVVPHDQYLPIIRLCAEKGIHIIKEKPFATSMEEGQEIAQIAQNFNIKILTSFQRRFHLIYQAYKIMLSKLGKISTINITYTISSKHPNSGWRASQKQAGGGAMLDMGYHMLDLIIWLFDKPIIKNVHLAVNRRKNYNTDDTGSIAFNAGSANGSLFISCIYPYKKEEMVVIGELGSATLSRECIIRYDNNYKVIEQKSAPGDWKNAMLEQLKYFYQIIQTDQDDYINSPKLQMSQHLSVMNDIYKGYI